MFEAFLQNQIEAVVQSRRRAVTSGTLSQVASNQPLFITAPPVGEVIYEESASNKRIEALA